MTTTFSVNYITLDNHHTGREVEAWDHDLSEEELMKVVKRFLDDKCADTLTLRVIKSTRPGRGWTGNA